MFRHPFETRPQHQQHQPQQRAFLTTLAQDPILAVTEHNTQQSEAIDLRASAPYNYIERAAGPFYSFDLVQRFARKLVKGTRGLTSLKKRIETLAAAYGVNCYGADVQLEGGELASAYLARRGAPASYVEAVERLERAGDVLRSATFV